MALRLRSLQKLQRARLEQQGLLQFPVRGIVTKAYQDNVPNPDKPAPWPYETKTYRWYHSLFNVDKTIRKMDSNSRVILIEGNVGAGKSTLARGLAEELGMKYFPEASVTDLYQMQYGFDKRDYNDRLPFTCKHFEVKEFYEDPYHWLVAKFQINKYKARHAQYCQAMLHLLSTGQGVIMERSPFSDFIFVDAMARKGYMSKEARRYYYQLKSNTIQELFRPHLVIYLDAPVDVCLERIKQRNTPYEVNSEVLTPDYLQMVETSYKERFLKQMEPISRTLVYDWKEIGDAETVAEDLEKLDDFDKDRYYFDPVYRDWRTLFLDSDWDELRVKYTQWKKWYEEIMDLPETVGAEELWIPAEENYQMELLEEEIAAKRSKFYVAPGDTWGGVKNFFKL